MALGTSLLDQLVQMVEGKRWEENPLRTIGFSPLLLNLGLSTEELYGFVRKTARTLFATLHEDRRGKSEAQIRLSQAFDVLKDKELFQKAMDEFRTLRSDLNHETETLRSLSRSQGVELEKLRVKLRKAQHEINYQPQARSAFANALQMQGFHVSEERISDLSPWEAMNPLDCTTLALTEVVVKKAHTAMVQKEDEARVQHEYKEILKRGGRIDKSVIENLRARSERAGMLAYSFGGVLQVQGVDSDEPLPLIYWDQEAGLIKNDLHRLATQPKPQSNHVFVGDETDEYKKALAAEYRASFNTLSNVTIPQSRVDKLAVSLRRAKLEQAGVVRSKGRRVRILGCFTSQGLGRISLESDLSHIQMSSAIMNFRPFLFRQGILVGVEEKKIQIRSHQPVAREDALRRALDKDAAPFIVLGVVLDFQ